MYLRDVATILLRMVESGISDEDLTSKIKKGFNDGLKKTE